MLRLIDLLIEEYGSIVLEGKVIRKIRISVFFLLICIFTSSVSAESSNKEEMSGFSVEAIIPDNQIDSKVTYYYLEVSPASHQTVFVKIRNTSNRERTFYVHINSAWTNSNGLIVYTKNTKELDDSMKFPLHAMVTPTENLITIPAMEEKIVELDINVPNESIEGIIMGGIHIGLYDKEKEASESKGMGVTNSYGYVTGMILTQDKWFPVNGKTEIKLVGIELHVDNGNKVLEVAILNPNPEIFGGLQMEGKVMRKGSSKEVVEYKQEGVYIAPNTVFPFEISLGKDHIEPGTYVFKGKGISGEKEWIFEEEFTIINQQEAAMNKEAMVKPATPKWITPSFIVFGVVTLGCMVILIKKFIRRKGK